MKQRQVYRARVACCIKDFLSGREETSSHVRYLPRIETDLSKEGNSYFFPNSPGPGPEYGVVCGVYVGWEGVPPLVVVPHDEVIGGPLKVEGGGAEVGRGPPAVPCVGKRRF